MSKRVYQKVLPPTELRVDPEDKNRVEQIERVQKVQEFRTLAEQVAKSTIFHRNWYVPELREQFKFFDRMKRIDKVFPYAKLGDGAETMLLVDEPKTTQETEVCELKSKHLKRLGYRYVWIEKDSTLYDALNQLELV